MDVQPKIFGIGLSKTGTTSLGVALGMLGYKVKHFPFRMLTFKAPAVIKQLCDELNSDVVTLDQDGLHSRNHLYCLGENQVDLDFLSKYDASVDLPVGLYYKALDTHYPGSRFVLTVRDEKAWIESARKHFDPIRAVQRSHEVNRMRLDMYGSIIFHEERFLAAYRKHVAEVCDYFDDRPDDLAVMNIGSGDGWAGLCAFVGKPVPNEPFPHANKSSDRI